MTYAPELSYLDDRLAIPVLKTVDERLAAFTLALGFMLVLVAMKKKVARRKSSRS